MVVLTRPSDNGQALFTKEDLLLYPDLRLYTAEGFYTEVSSVLLAAQSPLVRHLLQYVERPLDTSCVTCKPALITELDSEDISRIVQFVTMGVLPGEITPKVVTSFGLLGICLSELKLTKSSVSEPEEDIIFHSKFVEVKKESVAAIDQNEVLDIIPQVQIKTSADEELFDPDFGFQEDELMPDLEEDETDEVFGLDDLDEEDDDSEPQPKRKRSRKEKVHSEGKRYEIVGDPWNYFPPKTQKSINGTKKKTGYMYCNDCGFKTFLSKILEQHMLHHRVQDAKLDRSKFHCTIIQCLKAFHSEEEWSKHGEEVHGNKMFQCFHCDKTFPRCGDRNGHMSRIHSMNPEEKDSIKSVCVHCGAKFTRPEAFKKHLKFESTYHNNSCAYENCNETFNTWPEHEAHLRAKHNNQKVFICGVCPQLFHNKIEKRKHRMANHPEEMKGFYKQCSICGRHTNALARHMALEHNQDKPGFCTLCGGIEVKEIRTHMLQEHTERWKNKPNKSKSDSLLCPNCGETFTSRGALTNHLRYRHHNEEPSICSVCGASFASISSLKAHMSVLHGAEEKEEDKTLLCPNCPKMFSTKQKLASHIRAVHDLPHACVFCHTRFKLREELTAHKEAGCKNNFRVKCHLCNREMTKQRLKGHILAVHTPDAQKPFRCDVCNKGFDKRHILTDHMNTHTNARPFKCQFCNLAFRHRSVWIMHERKIHKREPRAKGNFKKEVLS